MTSDPRRSKIQSKPRRALKQHKDVSNETMSRMDDVDATSTKEMSRASKIKNKLMVSHKESAVILEKCDERLRGRLASVLDTVFCDAEAGNLQAAKFLLDRFMPDPRERHLNFDLREINSVDDAACAWSDVLTAMSQGKITLKEAQSIGELLKSYIDTTAALNKTMPKLANKHAALFLFKENEAMFCSINGEDHEEYFAVKHDNECELDFQKRAEAQLRQRFPKADVTVFSQAQCLVLCPEMDSDCDAFGRGRSDRTRLYLDKIRKNAQATRVEDEGKSLL